MDNHNLDKVIVISAINFFEGGPLSVLNDCLYFLNGYNKDNSYKIIALVHDLNLFIKDDFPSITFIEFKKSRKSYFYRLYYEYFYFNKFAKKKNVYFWLSLHDITPNLTGVKQAVYCHNPTIFSNARVKDFFYQPKHFFFTLFYRYLYQINLNKNSYIIVQQNWIKNNFCKIFNIYTSKVIVAPPEITKFNPSPCKTNSSKVTFIYPAYPRPFKNFEIICKAAKILQNRGKINFEIILTINGNENRYSKDIYDKYKYVDNIKFIGQIPREKLYEYYSECDCLLFTSKLETWGLPLTEFKEYNKPIIVSNLEYARETIGLYSKVLFFDQNNAKLLADIMYDFINDSKNFKYSSTHEILHEKPYAKNWKELFDIML